MNPINKLKSNQSEEIQVVICVEILLKTIAKTNIRYFDLVLLIPSFMFGLFLIFQCRSMMKSIIYNNSSIISTFYVLLCLACTLKVIRSLVGMFLGTSKNIRIVDKSLWLIVRFFLLATEMSIITFGVAAARLDTQAGIRRVLIVTSLISLTYTATQATLEFVLPDRRFDSLYGHGGALFFFVSSLLFFIVYCAILILPSIGCDKYLKLPTKKLFYIYCGILALLYLIESIGSILFYVEVAFGLCVIDITTLIYFIGYDPLVYVTFLYNYMRNRKASASKYNQNIIDYPETSEEYYKTYSNVTNSASQNHLNQYNHSVNDQHLNSGDCMNNLDNCSVENSTHFYPDNLVTVDRDNTDVMNISQIMKNYNIMPEGAQLEYTTRYSSSVIPDENPSPEEREKSIILSLSDELESVRRGTWDLADFANT